MTADGGGGTTGAGAGSAELADRGVVAVADELGHRGLARRVQVETVGVDQ